MRLLAATLLMLAVAPALAAEPAPARELAADDRGAGPAVLLLHAQPGSRHDYAQLARRLEATHRVIVPDRPGYGASAGPAGGFYDNAEAAVALLDRLGIARATIVGHSWGGGVALALAERYPERVERLVLAGSVGTREALAPVDRLLARPHLGRFVARALFGAPLQLVKFAPLRRLAEHQAERRGFDRGIVAETRRAWSTGPAWRSFHLEQRTMLAETPRLEAALATISVPTIVLHGTRDSVVRPAAGRALAERLGNATLEPVAGQGHLLPQRAPDLVARAVRGGYDARLPRR
jgi:pimeloyl-ACP methyl ester carboxylesterase